MLPAASFPFLTSPLPHLPTSPGWLCLLWAWEPNWLQAYGILSQPLKANQLHQMNRECRLWLQAVIKRGGAPQTTNLKGVVLTHWKCLKKCEQLSVLKCFPRIHWPKSSFVWVRFSFLIKVLKLSAPSNNFVIRHYCSYFIHKKWKFRRIKNLI